MEPIIRSPAVAKETRQLRRPGAGQGEQGGVQQVRKETTIAGQATSANRGEMPVFPDEKKPVEVQGKPAGLNNTPPVDGEEKLKRRLANEKALADAQAAAEKRGYAAGLEKGKEEAKKAVAEQVERLSSVIAALRGRKTEMIESGEDELVEIVYTAVCRIIGENAVTPEAVSGVVKQVVALTRDRDQLTIRLHPGDFELLQNASSQAGAVIVDKAVNLVPDVAIELGGCIVEGATGSLDARLELQMDRLREALIETRRNREQNEESV